MLKLMRNGPAAGGACKRHSQEARPATSMLDGQIPTPPADPQGDVYRSWLLAACAASITQLLPNLFEGLDDAPSCLLPG